MRQDGFEGEAMFSIDKLWRAMALLALLVAALPANAARCYVKPGLTASDDGTSWSSPMAIGNALNDTNCAEIWMAQGVYKPGPPGGVQYAFVLRSNLKLYGGFFGIPGTEGDLSQRDTLQTPSVLSGDIGNDDIVDGDGVTQDFASLRGQNSRHLLYIDGSTPMNNTQVDGFTVTAGKGGSVHVGGGRWRAELPRYRDRCLQRDIA